jgi:hypothetical protein
VKSLIKLQILHLRRRSKRKKCQNKNWYDFDLRKQRKLLNEKALLMSKYPKNPFITGAFHKSNKEFAKLRKLKKREYTQNISDKLDNLQTNNPKEYWRLVNSLRSNVKDGLVSNIDCNTWSDYFSNLSKTPAGYMERIDEINKKINDMKNDPNFSSFSNLDFRITTSELSKALNKLKKNKSPGLDTITNEMLKAVQIYLNPLFLKLFNAIFIAGIYPEKWSEGYITPIFKSDNSRLPQNYRGITITSCVGKLFNIILNNRLDKFLLEHNIIHETQIGFSKNSRTSDHLFVLKCLVDKYINSGGKRLYACFVDFHKAFDTVIHSGIKCKLLQCGISGLFYNILCSMYSAQNKISVKIGDRLTDPFIQEIGVSKGDVLSHNIFKIFLNDFSKTLDEYDNDTHVCL